jgi:uncharacterized protein YndB with AHSA1/START domain
MASCSSPGGKAPAKGEDARVARTEVEVAIAAPRAKVWRSLVADTAKWWPADFVTSPRTARMVIEPKVGGMMFEDFGGGAGLAWFQVVGVDPERSLRLAGWLFVDYGGPCTSLVHITLEDAKDGGTTFRLSDALLGRIPDEQIPKLSVGWRAIFEGALKPHCEKRRSKRGHT